MKVLLLPSGSHGDVHPFVGVALRLKERGHEVTLATNSAFADLALRSGIPFHEVGTEDDFRDLSDDPDLWNPRKAPALIARKAILPVMQMQYQAIQELAAAEKVVLVGSALGFGTRMAHDALGLPFVSLHLQPTMFWSVHETPYLDRRALLSDWVPHWLKNLQFRIGIWLAFDRHLKTECNAFRASSKLPPVASTWELVHSPQRICAMFPEWYARRQSDWPAQTVLTGFPRWDEKGVTPLTAEIRNFLDDGDPPIAFTPGSAHTHATEFWLAAIDACQRLGRRGMLFTRHVDQVPRQLPAGVRHFQYGPFSEVLPRCAALVYHGGIGTLSQALAAGVPHVIMPMAYDQPDNANRIRKLGVGDFLWPNHFQGSRLSQMLSRLMSSRDVVAACQKYKQLLSEDDAVAKTCDVIESVALN